MKLPAQKKKEAVLKVVRDKKSVTNVAGEYGVARKTLYSWIKRYKKTHDGNIENFKPRYVRGKKHPRSKPSDIEERLLFQRRFADLILNELPQEVQFSF